MLEIVWSFLKPYQSWFLVFGCSFAGLMAFIQIWKIQLEKAYVRYTELLFSTSLSMKDAEKMFMGIFFQKEKGTKGEEKVVRQEIRKAVKTGRLIKIDFTYEGEMQARYVAHDEDVHAFRALMFKQAKYIKMFKWLRPFNIYRFTLHDLEFKEAINQ